MIYPWLEKQWQKITEAIEDQRLPHAIMLTGQQGLGKFNFAMQLAQRALCLQPQAGKSCGHCHSCQLVKAGTHADLQMVAPLEDSKVLKVDQIRELIERNSLTPHISTIKIHLICDADKMNSNAANSLLKTLEEPSPNSLLILLSSRPDNLPATIRSRCQQIKFLAPEREIALNWLQHQALTQSPELLLSMAQGAPLTALALDNAEIIQLRKEVFAGFGKVIFKKLDPVEVASHWQSLDLPQILQWMTNWTVDMMRLKFSHDQSKIDNVDLLAGLKKIADYKSRDQLLMLYKNLLEATRLLQTQVNQNLLTESLLLKWVQ